MENYFYYLLFADYNDGAYGTSLYGENTTTGTGTQTAGGGTTGTLTNTGFEVLVIATVACVVIFAALLVKFSRRSKPVAVAEEVSNQE
jgi:hypothetical protein